MEENNFAKCGAGGYNTLLKACDLIFIRNDRNFLRVMQRVLLRS